MTLKELRARHFDEERQYVLETLRACNHGLRATATALDVTPSSVFHILRRLDLYPEYRKNKAKPGRPAGKR